MADAMQIRGLAEVNGVRLYSTVFETLNFDRSID
jgi:hypothetical protein